MPHDDEHPAFLRRTYAHLLGAVVAFVAVEAALLSSGVGVAVLKSVRGAGVGGWIGLMAAFVGGGFAAQWMARSRRAVAVQYSGLALYVLIEAVIFLPVLTIATQFPQFAGQNLPVQAGIVALLAFGGLTAGVVRVADGFAVRVPGGAAAVTLAIGVTVSGGAFGFSPGLGVVAVFVGLAVGFILYRTPDLIRQHSPRDHVAASLSLFAAVALMFLIVVHVFAASSDD